MEQILFKGKCIDNNEWVEGYYYESKISGCFILVPKIKVRKKDGVVIGDSFDVFNVIPETVGQYTGVIDENGTMIFEGDVLETEGPDETEYRDVVHFGRFNDDDNHGNEYVGFYVKSGNYTTSLLEMPLGKHNYCCVIGNIYDNPELLEDMK